MSDVHLNLHIVKFFVLTLFNLVLFLLYIHLNSLAETFHCKYLVAKTSSNLARNRSERSTSRSSGPLLSFSPSLSTSRVSVS